MVNDPNYRWLVDRFNHLLKSLSGGSNTPYTSHSGPADIAYQFRHDVAAWETLYIRAGYQRIFHEQIVVNGDLRVDGMVLVI